MLTAREVYKLAASGFSVKEIREIEVRQGDIDRLRLTLADARFLAGCGVRVETEDLFFAEGTRPKKKHEYRGTSLTVGRSSSESRALWGRA